MLPVATKNYIADIKIAWLTIALIDASNLAPASTWIFSLTKERKEERISDGRTSRWND
jgi:hypothetical protein